MKTETKKNQGKKKVLILALLVGSLALVFGTAFALYSDTLDAQVLTLTSGTLDIEVDSADPVTFVASDGTMPDATDPLVPGDSFTIDGSIKNNGNAPAKVRVNVVADPANPTTSMWTNTYALHETTLAGGATLDLSTITGSLVYELGDLTNGYNTNTEQNKTYTFTIKVDAMQADNTTDTDWSNIVTVPFTITVP